MKKPFAAFLMIAIFALAGCQSTLDREATRQNDINMQRETRENDELTKAAVEAGEITETSAAIAAERRHKARRLARAMARDAGNEDLPEIPTKLEDEPEPVDPE